MRRALFLAIAAGTLTVSPAGAQQLNPPGKSRVVVVRESSALPAIETDAARARAMVATGITILTGRDTEAAAWASLVSSNDVVGIKVTSTAAPLQATRRSVVDAIAAGLQAAGIAQTNIIVWDRDAEKLREAGFVEEPGGYRVVGVAPQGWDAAKFLEGAQVGKLIWGDLLFGTQDNELSTRSHFPAVLTQRVTKLLNVPVLQDNEACGIAGCLYNVSLGAIDNYRRFELPGRFGDPVIAEIHTLAFLRGKLVLNVMDALVAGYAGGPAFKTHFSWRPGTLYFSRDPVAIDALCLPLLDAQRVTAKLSPVAERAIHIQRAALLGIGIADTNRIERIERQP